VPNNFVGRIKGLAGCGRGPHPLLPGKTGHRRQFLPGAFASSATPGSATFGNYIKRGRPWDAFVADARPVLLIDEIDKADIEFPGLAQAADGQGYRSGYAARDPKKLIPPLHGALLKNEQDVRLFERLAFIARRDGR
jgi:hypothetical protein